MSNQFGKNLTLTLFGESHGPAIGCVIDGLPAGLKIDLDWMANRINQRKASGTISTARTEADLPEFLSGVRDAYTEGDSICLIIRNENVRRNDYATMKHVARPGHADYTAQCKYNGFQDGSGGGHFSGRLTAPLVAAGAILESCLRQKGIRIGSHIEDLAGIQDDAFSEESLAEQLDQLSQSNFPVLNAKIQETMIARIEQARADRDSVGGILETRILGLPAGIGEPFFDSVESRLASMLFSIPAVKGVSFGSGFELAHLSGSQANDAFRNQDGTIVTTTNHNGGINGGITNGMPVVFHTCIKPTPSIAQVQDTIDFVSGENTTIEIVGRHDPAILHRARAVVDTLSAFVLADLLVESYGKAWLLEDSK